MPRFVYASFCNKIMSFWFLYLMFWAFMFVVNVGGRSLDLLRHHVIAHLFIPRSICGQL